MYSPTLEEFLKLAAQGNLIPVTRRLLADVETPLSAYRKIRGQGESFLFESVEGGEHLGRYSFVGCNPPASNATTAKPCSWKSAPSSPACRSSTLAIFWSSGGKNPPPHPRQ